jgi:hypothetical protein
VNAYDFPSALPRIQERIMTRRRAALAAAALLAFAPAAASAQSVISGRLMHPRAPGSSEDVPMVAVYCFGGLDGPGRQAVPFRTWETEPAGWFELPGAAGNTTVLFTAPAFFMRPLVLTNLHLRPGEKLDRRFVPRFDYAVFEDRSWDEKPATDYWQTFVAKGTSVTSVGFKFATDGVDGVGPGAQTILASIHRKGDGTPDQWPQVGPTIPVPDVDCGGPKNYWYSAAWDSGEVPLTPGDVYAVHLRAEKPGGVFQTFWGPLVDKDADCYRLGAAGATGWQGKSLWMTVAADGDGLVIPYAKRVRKEFQHFAGFSKTWSQSWVARGRGLASALLYAAVGTAEPPLSRQRATVRVRRGGPDGPVVGIEKIAIGNGNYTGDASWGVVAAVFAPGEVPLEPGQTYAVEFESIESKETLHGFINIKNVTSSGDPGLNPYRKHPPDAYPKGAAYKHGREPQEFDLDMQIIEYEHAATDWSKAVEGDSLIKNGGMDGAGADAPEGWTRFAIDPATKTAVAEDLNAPGNRLARVIGGGLTGTARDGSGREGNTADGGFVQRVEGLSPLETYRLSGRMRSSYAIDPRRQSFIGWDPTGQTEDPKAATIVWTMLPEVSGVWTPHLSEPIRPAKGGAVSVWLRGRCTHPWEFPFKADFDDIALRKVRTSPPDGR